MDAVGREIRHALRRLASSPEFTVATLLTLTLAVGANTTIFTVVSRVVLNPLPYPDSDRLVALDYGIPTRNVAAGINYMSWQLYYQLVDRARTFERVAIYNVWGATLTGAEGTPEHIQISRATPSLASVLGVQPVLGRWFTEQEGVPGRSTLTFRIALPDREYASRRAAVAAHRAIVDRLQAIPDVTAASAVTCLPLVPFAYGKTVVPEHVVDDGAVQPRAFFYAVAAGYFETIGMRLLRGRFIDSRDVERGEPVVVVNHALAETVFRNHDPIGQRIRSPRLQNPSLNSPGSLEIVGVVSNTPAVSLSEAMPVPQLYMPMSIAGGPDVPIDALIGPSVSIMSYAVRTSTAPSNLVAAVRTAVGEIDPNLALFDVQSLEDIVDRSAAQTAFTMIVIVIAASIALMLGVIGIYGVMAYIVSQRTSEIGIRLALGAAPGQVAGMIVRQGGLVAMAGVVAGLGLACAGSRLVASLIYGVSPRDPVVYAATTALLSIVALLASSIPALRGARLSPVEALRTE